MIIMAGISYQKAHIDIREKFVFRKSELRRSLERVKEEEGVRGCVILSTCNRVELWLSAIPEATVSPGRLLCREKGLSWEEYSPLIVERQEKEAISYLFHLSAGLESQIVGEDQILSQVGDALTLARECYATEQTLEVLFRMAVTAGKQVKTRVELPRANASASGAMVERLERDGFSFAGKSCLVVGNGMLGKLTAVLLMEKGADVTVTIRQYRSGVVDVPRRAKRVNYEDRYLALQDCDFLFSATASPNLTITAKRLGEAGIKKRLVAVDLAVPRDIEPEVAKLENVCYYHTDMLGVKPLSDGQEKALREIEAILGEAIEEYIHWYEVKDMLPRLLELGRLAAGDVVVRLQKPLRAMERERDTAAGSEPEGDTWKRLVEEAARKSVCRLLFGVRDGVDNAALEACVRAMERVYEE